mmetsp:Transcript_37084/g.106142  ORF Transcript_37084/g.106142 Transcript_37084/m.106142 type:complete len:89 (-) Transcript_37084:163-429(-)
MCVCACAWVQCNPSKLRPTHPTTATATHRVGPIQVGLSSAMCALPSSKAQHISEREEVRALSVSGVRPCCVGPSACLSLCLLQCFEED